MAPDLETHSMTNRFLGQRPVPSFWPFHNEICLYFSSCTTCMNSSTKTCEFFMGSHLALIGVCLSSPLPALPGPATSFDLRLRLRFLATGSHKVNDSPSDFAMISP